MTFPFLGSLPLSPLHVSWIDNSFLVTEYYCIAWMDHSLLIHSPTEGHCSCYNLFYNYKKAAVNIQCIFLCVSFLSLWVNATLGGLYS